LTNFLRRLGPAFIALSIAACGLYEPAFAQAQTPIQMPGGVKYDFGKKHPLGNRAILLVGDSYIGGRSADEPWAQPWNFQIVGGGFVSRMQLAIGTTPGGSISEAAFLTGMGHVQAASSITTGNLFGGAAQFDILGYVQQHPEIEDVVMIIGHNDFNGGLTACSHGTPFDPTSTASGACTVAQTIDNLKYVFDGLTSMGRNVHWQMPPGWLGLFQDDALNETPDGDTFQNAIEDVLDALITHCSGKTCYPGAEMYIEACKGDTTAPDPTAAGNCSANNSVDYGDGAGLVNRLNAPVVFNEDALHQERTIAELLVGSYRLHPSGYGYSAFFRALMAAIKADDSTIDERFLGFSLDWTSRPGVPNVTVGTVTTSSIQVTVSRGLHVNGSAGSDGRCLYGSCVYTCWVTCVDTGEASPNDPACAVGIDSPLARDIGAISGAAHYIEDDFWIDAPRDVIQLQNGETGVIAGLENLTDYKLVCVAQSPTAISHPAVRNVTTP
jgi:hypothetical protein